MFLYLQGEEIPDPLDTLGKGKLEIEKLLADVSKPKYVPVWVDMARFALKELVQAMGCWYQCRFDMFKIHMGLCLSRLANLNSSLYDQQICKDVAPSQYDVARETCLRAIGVLSPFEDPTLAWFRSELLSHLSKVYL